MTMDDACKVAAPHTRRARGFDEAPTLEGGKTALPALRHWLFRTPTPMLGVTAGSTSGRWRLRDRLRSRLKSGRSSCLGPIPATTHMISERRWQKRLSRPLRQTPDASSLLHVEVIHRFPASNRYGWEIRPLAGLPVEESRVQFASWEEASQAGKLALNQFLQHP